MTIATEAIREYLGDLRKLIKRDVPGLRNQPHCRLLDDSIDALTEHESEFNDLVDENMDLQRKLEERDEDAAELRRH